MMKRSCDSPRACRHWARSPMRSFTLWVFPSASRMVPVRLILRYAKGEPTDVVIETAGQDQIALLSGLERVMPPTLHPFLGALSERLEHHTNAYVECCTRSNAPYREGHRCWTQAMEVQR
jgi:hypothetical protein